MEKDQSIQESKNSKKLGYCKLEKLRNDEGKIIGQEYHIFEHPYVQNSNMDASNQPHVQNSNVAQNEIEPDRRLLHVANQDVENQDVENQDVENSYYSNNNSSNNELSNNEGEREGAHTQNFSDQKIKQPPVESKLNQESKQPVKPLSKKVAPKKVFPGKLTFEQSPYFEFESFEAFLQEIGCGDLDCEHYHTKIKLNAQAKGLQQQDWKAYIQNWIYEDKRADKLIWKKQEASIENEQEEISRKIDQISQDLHAGVFTTSQSLHSILESLRQYWKEADDSNRSKMETLAQTVKAELESLAKQPKKQVSASKTINKPKTKKNRLRDRLQDIKAPDNTS